MNRVVLDASALGAMVFGEPEGDRLFDRLRGATVHAPALLRFELMSIAWKKVRRQPDDALAILTALRIALDESTGIEWCDVNSTDVVLVAQATQLTVYDATYLWLAGSLGADLVTLDRRLAEAGAAVTV